jgi:hypothetical protein
LNRYFGNFYKKKYKENAIVSFIAVKRRRHFQRAGEATEGNYTALQNIGELNIGFTPKTNFPKRADYSKRN